MSNLSDSDIDRDLDSLQQDFLQLAGHTLCQSTQYGRIVELNNFIKTGIWGQENRFYHSEDDDGSDLFDELNSKYLSALSQIKELIKELQKHGINTDEFTRHSDESGESRESRESREYKHLLQIKRIFIAISELSRDIFDDSTREQLYREFNKQFAGKTIERYILEAERFMFNAEDDPSFPIENVLHVKTSEVICNPENPDDPFGYQSVLLEPLGEIMGRLRHLMNLLNK